MAFMRYITKDDVFDAIKGWKTGRKEDLNLSIRAIKTIKVRRSRKLAPVHIESEEEWCPHCRKALKFYDIVNNSPRYCYCMWCGGAIDRLKGNKNGYFDYQLLEGRQPVEDIYPDRPTNGQIKFAQAISQELGIPLPKDPTTNNYWHFINEHQKEYYKSSRDKKSLRDRMNEAADKAETARIEEYKRTHGIFQ